MKYKLVNGLIIVLLLSTLVWAGNLGDAPSNIPLDHQTYVTAGDGSDHADVVANTALAHRPWNWHDEQGQVQSFRLPLSVSTATGWDRYASNPVFVGSENAAKFDGKGAGHHCMKYRHHNNTTYMFYMGYNNVWGSFLSSLGYATSTDFVTFTIGNSGDAILVPTDFEAGAKRLMFPQVVYDDYNDRWLLWANLIRSDDSYAYVYAYTDSAEPDSGWAGHTITNLTGYAGGPFGVSRFGSMFYLLAHGAGPIRFVACYSNDGTTWTASHTALSLGAGGKWDDDDIAYASIFWNQGIAYLLYAGHDSGETWEEFHIGMGIDSKQLPLYSFDRWWVNDGEILAASGVADAQDEDGVLSPSMIAVDGVFYLYYTGRNIGDADSGICLATIPAGAV